MSKTISFLFSPLHCPYENLAIENYLLERVLENERIYFFYSNKPSIVIGRFQNPWIECDLKRVYEEGIHFVRRQSGGGTVFHDLGNLNFCVIDGRRELSKEMNNELFINHNGPKKISGSAFKQKKNSSFHHGTLLIDAHLNSLNGLLKGKHDFSLTKSISSVSSKVMNLKDICTGITMDLVIDKIKGKLLIHENVREINSIHFDSSLIDLVFLEKMKSWQWQIGETPLFEFSHQERGITGGFEINLKCRKGVLESIHLTHEEIHPKFIELITSQLISIPLNKEDLNSCFERLFSFFDSEDDRALGIKVKAYLEELHLFL